MKSAAAVIAYGIVFYLCGTLALNLGLVRPTDVFVFALIMALPPLAGWGIYYVAIPKIKRPPLDRAALKRLGLAVLVYVTSLVTVSYGGTLLSALGVTPIFYVFVMPVVVLLLPFMLFWTIAKKTLVTPDIKMPSNLLLFLVTGSVVVLGTLGLLAPAAFSGLTGSEYIGLAIVPLAVVGLILILLDLIFITRWLIRRHQKRAKN